jgi:hypothetical protein
LTILLEEESTSRESRVIRDYRKRYINLGERSQKQGCAVSQDIVFETATSEIN